MFLIKEKGHFSVWFEFSHVTGQEEMKCQAIRFMPDHLANAYSSLRDRVVQPTHDPLVGSKINWKNTDDQKVSFWFLCSASSLSL